MAASDIIFFKKNDLLPKFIFLYITSFFLYGYLFLFGAFLSLTAFYYLYISFQGIYKYIQILWFIPMIYCFVRSIIILTTTRYKWRLFRIAHYRMKTRGYSENYFKYEIYEPCTRLIVKNVLYEYGLKDEYTKLKIQYLKVNQRVEDQKLRMISALLRRDKQNQLQEGYDEQNV